MYFSLDLPVVIPFGFFASENDDFQEGENVLESKAYFNRRV